MSTFDTLFFEQHINDDEKIQKVFHRHFFVIIEDLLVWVFFALLIPTFFYYFNVFNLQQIPIDRTYIHAYLFVIYFLLLYKIFDWYLDVWIATDQTLVDMRWKWFTPQILYIAYNKIESIEVRTPSWLFSMVGISDVCIHMAGDESHTLSSAAYPKEIVAFLQDAIKSKKPSEVPDDREPFEVLVDTLSGVVKHHLDEKWAETITKDYVERLDNVLADGIPIDLRSDDEKHVIDAWKERHIRIETNNH